MADNLCGCSLQVRQRQGQAGLTHLFLRNFGRWRCWYALISTRLSLPKCWVSEWASINCLLNSLLPWFSSMFQSVCVSHSGLIFHREARAFCMNQLLFPTDQLFKSMDVPNVFFSLQHCWHGWRFEAFWMSFGESLYKLTPLAEGCFMKHDERKTSLS